MKDEIEERLKACQQALAAPAATLSAVQRVYGDAVRDETIASYGRMVEAHHLLMGVLGAALLRVNGKVTETTPDLNERSSLMASFVIGLDACERALAEGRYLQAHALLRQEMETVAQLTSIQQGCRKEGRQPGVGVLGKSLSRFYGDLSAATHLASSHMVRSVTTFDSGDTRPSSDATHFTRYFPAFDKDLARRSFALHLVLILHVLEQMRVDYSTSHYGEECFDEHSIDALELTLSLMVDEGVLVID